MIHLHGFWPFWGLIDTSPFVRCHGDTIEVMHANGRRVAQDYAAAVNWYPKARKAADQGSRRGPRLG
jgi:hypothetical protein